MKVVVMESTNFWMHPFLLISTHVWSWRQTLSVVLRESIPRQIDKKLRVPQEEKGFWGFWSGDWGLEFSRRRKGETFFFPLHSLVSVNYTTQFKLCTRDYTTTMYWAGGQFLLPENLLTNSDILECILWEWVWRIFLLLNI